MKHKIANFIGVVIISSFISLLFIGCSVNDKSKDQTSNYVISEVIPTITKDITIGELELDNQENILTDDVEDVIQSLYISLMVLGIQIFVRECQ